jgi:ribosomal 50S subunit-recycling heat shock protein
MRIDKYLKVTRIIKRRELAKEMLDQGFISLNGKTAKPAQEVKEGDEITIKAPSGRVLSVKVTEVRNVSTIKDADEMYQTIASSEKKGN